MIATKNTATAPAKRTPYCDTCYRKGLSEKEYTSHYTKSEAGPRGVVVCPTILNAVCRACGNKGHWASEKFCPLMRREAKEDRRYNEREQKMPTKPPVVKKMNENRYAALMDDEGDAVAVAAPAPKPVVVASKTVATLAPSGPSWADMAKKPAVLVPRVEPSPLTTLKFNTVYYDSKETKYEPLMTDAEREAYKIMMERKAAGCFNIKRSSSWMEESSDEDEEDDYQEMDNDDEDW